jgi:hypothetical protein
MYKRYKDFSMKFKSIYLIAIAAFIMIAAASCKKDLAKANTNPDQITGSQVDPNLLLTTVQLAYTGAPTEGGSVWVTKWGGVGMFIQHVASTGGFYYGDKYLNNIGAMGETFQDNYTSAVQPAVEVYQLTANKPQYRNLHQMARIMKAMIFQQLTDLYGDIPYFQAGLGYYDRIYTPVYDKQQVIYADLLKEVSQATDSLTESGDKPSGDILYSQANDQIAEWKMFGNSLLLRMAMRLTKVDPATAQKYVAQVMGKTMKSNGDNAIVLHVLSANALTSNQDAAQILSQDSLDIRLSSTLISNMRKLNDPRLPAIAWIAYGLSDPTDPSTFPGTTDVDTSDQVGLPNGYIIGGNNPLTNLNIVAKDSLPAEGLGGYSRISPNLLSINSPSLILTYAETELLFADAAQRWGIGGNAADHYNAGMTAAIEQYAAYGVTIDGGVENAYIAAQAYKPAKGLSQINYQYWLSTLMDEYESWANWRRSGDLPKLTPTNYPGNISGGTIPRRLVYPPSQKVTNLTNYNAAVAILTGGDHVTSRVWWDTQ